MDKTPDTSMYTTIFRKYHAQAISINIPKKIIIFFKVAFIKKDNSFYKPNLNFWNSPKICIEVFLASPPSPARNYHLSNLEYVDNHW